MPQHDEYARYTPYELALPGPSFARERFEAMAREIEARGIETHEPATLMMVKAAQETLERLQGPSRDAESTRRHAVLLYHALHFHRAGEPLYLLGTHAARFLVEAAPDVDGSPSPPTPAGYLQLPRHLFWVESMDDRPPEAADGIFWCTPAEARLAALLVLGMRGDRPGMSVVPVPVVPVADAGAWAREPVREGAGEFANTLPGGEIEGLYSLETAGEVLKLLARTFWFLERHPDTVREEGGAGTWTDPGAGQELPESPGPRPSSLAYRKILLQGDPRPDGTEQEA